MKSALLIGGAGFVGSVVARRLSALGARVTVPTRRRQHAGHLVSLPGVSIVEADVRDPATLARLVAGQDLVVNFVGILRGDMQHAHVVLAARIAQAVADASESGGRPHFVHVSALAAAPDAPSVYLRSKAAGEAAVKAAFPAVTIFQPSVIFGARDIFLNLFSRLQKVVPVMLLACPEARFQPVWVENVADVLIACLDHPESQGMTYPLGGPAVYTLRELVTLAGVLGGRARPIIGLPLALSYLQAWVMECLPGGPMTRDNVRSMQVPNVCPPGVSLPFGLVAASLEAVAPGYLDGRS